MAEEIKKRMADLGIEVRVVARPDCCTIFVVDQGEDVPDRVPFKEFSASRFNC